MLMQQDLQQFVKKQTQSGSISDPSKLKEIADRVPALNRRKTLYLKLSGYFVPSIVSYKARWLRFTNK